VKENACYFVKKKNRTKAKHFERIALNVSATNMRFWFHVTKLIRCDRTRQRSNKIINKETSFSPNTFHWASIFFERNLWQTFIWRCKNLNFKKMALFSVADTLIRSYTLTYFILKKLSGFAVILFLKFISPCFHQFWQLFLAKYACIPAWIPQSLEC